MKRNQSIMVVATHQCNWEWVLMSGSAQWSYPLDAVYLPLSNKKIDKLMLKTRSRFGGNPIPAQNVISEMKRRQHITVAYGMLADQVPPKKSKKYWTKFMNQETAFLLGPEQLPKLFNYPVIFLSTTRLKRGYYQIDLKKVAEVRNLEKIKARFVIIDSNQLLFMLLDDEKFHPNYDTGVWINTEFFAQALEQLFDLAWKNMKSVKYI